MDTLDAIIALTKTIVITAIIVAALYICALWMKMSIDTNEMFQLTVTLDTRKEENNEVPCIDSRS